MPDEQIYAELPIWAVKGTSWTCATDLKKILLMLPS